MAATGGAVLGGILTVAGLIATIVWGGSNHPHITTAVLLGVCFTAIARALSTSVMGLVYLIAWTMIGEPVIVKCRKRKGLSARATPTRPRRNSLSKKVMTGGTCGAAAGILAAAATLTSIQGMAPEPAATLGGAILGTITGAGLGTGIVSHMIADDAG